MKKNYIVYTSVITVVLVVIMSIISLFASTEIFSIKIRQANIYSTIISGAELRELVGFEGAAAKGAEELYDPLMEIADSLTSVVDSSAVVNEQKSDALVQRDNSITSQREYKPVKRGGVVSIEDFSAGGASYQNLRDRMDQSSSRSIRIAFMGDSYVEGDIFTMDLRESLQSEYGGGGVGFVPITSPVARFRGTVKHSFSDDWKATYITKEYRGAEYLLSGVVFTPEEGSWVEYETMTFRKHAALVDRTTLLFINRGRSTITVEVDGGAPQKFTPSSSDKIQHITIDQSIKRIKFSFTEVDGLTLYGALLDGGSGVSVDNYSIRGNSGMPMSAVSVAQSQNIRGAMDYDLIVLEYGLNVANEDTQSYRGYAGKIGEVIEHLKLCYPGTPILVMGVGERAIMEDGVPVTMPSVLELNREQRSVASRCGVIYWSTIDAMRSMGGIAEFVERGWAAKDYTHLGVWGGKQIAAKLYEALFTGQIDSASREPKPAQDSIDIVVVQQRDTLVDLPRERLDSVAQDSVVDLLLDQPTVQEIDSIMDLPIDQSVEQLLNESAGDTLELN